MLRAEPSHEYTKVETLTSYDEDYILTMFPGTMTTGSTDFIECNLEHILLIGVLQRKDNS